MEQIEEASISAKKRELKDAEKTLKGLKSFKSMAILTAENPDSKPTPEINKKQNRSLLKDLKSWHYVTVPASGKFDNNTEHSYAVLNIAKDVAAALCGKYQQTSFIFVTNDNGSIKNEYWEKENPEMPYDRISNPYVKKDEEKTILKLNGDSKAYSQVGGFKFLIPFSIFESIDENLLELNKGEKIIEHTMGIGMSPFLWRKCIYKGSLED